MESGHRETFQNYTEEFEVCFENSGENFQVFEAGSIITGIQEELEVGRRWSGTENGLGLN